MKKLFAIIALTCLSITIFSACQDDYYTYFETRDFVDYSPHFEFFPKSIGNAEVLNYGDTTYNYWSESADEFLVLKFHSTDEFSKEIERIIDKAVRKNPKERYQDIEEMHNDLLLIKNMPSLLKEKKGLLSRIFGFK